LGIRDSVALALLLVLMACGRGEEASPVGGSLTLEQAEARVKELVEETATAVLPGHPRTPEPDNDQRTPCMDAVGGFTDERTVRWGVEIDLEGETDERDVIDRTRSYWESQGYQVNTNSVEADPPSLFLVFDGYSFEMLVNADLGKAFLGGNTPCIRPES